MKIRKIMIPLILVLLFVAIGSVTAASYEINETSYSEYFEDDGTFKTDTTITNGDELVINGDISDKNFIIDKNVTIDGKGSGKLINGTITLNSGDSSGSIVRGISIINTDKNAIEVTSGASYIKIVDTTINMRTTDEYIGWSLSGIYTAGETSFIEIIDNIILFSGNFTYNYGIYITCFGLTTGNPKNYTISGNKITFNTEGYYAAGIYADSPVNFTIKNNELDLTSVDTIYGIVISDMFLYDFGANLIPSRGIEIINNSIKAEGKSLFLVELYQLGIWDIFGDYGEFTPIIIAKNTMYGKGVSVYGIAIASSECITIDGNDITTIGGDYKSITSTGDYAAPIGSIVPINLFGNSWGPCQYINITNNKFESNNGITVGAVNASTLPRDIIEINNTQTFIIDDDSYSNFFDEYGEFLNDLNVVENSTLKLGNLHRKKLVIDRKLYIDSYDTASMLLYTQIILKSDASGSLIQNLYMISDSNVLTLDGSSDNIIKNNVIMIRSSIDGAWPNPNTVEGILLSGDSSRNQILNNQIQIEGTLNPTLGAYFYGISISGSDEYWNQYNPDSNIISGNKIDVSGGYAAGISTSSAKNTTISNNDISLSARDFVYGIIIQDWSYGNSAPATNNQIINNKVTGQGSMVYLIESINCENSIISGNTLNGEGDAVYGYASSGSKKEVISGNTINIKGTDVANAPANFDTIKSGHAGIFANGTSTLSIKDNNIVSTYQKGGDYGILITNSATGSVNTIENNYVSSDNGNKIGNEAIAGASSDVIGESTPKRTTITIKTTTITKGKTATITATLVDNSGKAVANQNIQLTINGKTYNANTNTNGVATFKISSLGVGTFSTIATYGGSTNYIKSTANANQVVKGIADLKITKVKRVGNKYKLRIKNQGSAKIKATKLKIAYKKNKYKIVKVKALGVGKAVTVTVKFFKYSTHKKYKKVAKVNYKKAAVESNYKNNVKKFKL